MVGSKGSNTQSPLRAAIYCRISLARFGDTLKVDAQEDVCRQLAAAKGWTVSDRHVYKDNSKSAWKPDRKRPGWDAMVEAITNGEVQAIIVYHGDRLIRAPRDLEDLIDLAQRRGILLASPTGQRDLGNYDDQFILRIEAAAQHREVAATSRRVSAHYDRMAEQGLSRFAGCGGRTFGYERDFVTINADEAEQIRDAARRLLAGDQISAIARDLNTRGFTTTAGGPWEAGNLKKLMMRPRIAGLLVLRGTVVGPGAWPPILDRDTWELVCDVLKHRATQFVNVSNTRKYLLSGIAKCDSCKAGVAVRQARGQDTLRGYACINPDCTKKVHRAVHHVDPYVEGKVVGRLQDPKVRERATTPDAKPLLEELARLERRREQTLIEFADDEELGADVLRVTIRRIDQQIAEVRARITASQATHALDGLWGITRDEWKALPLARKRNAIQALVRVTILPSGRKGPGFDPATVLVEDA